MYLDGGLRGSLPISQGLQFDVNGYVHLGYFPECRTVATASFDDFRVYDYPMTASEVSALYTSTSTCASASGIVSENLDAAVKIVPNPSTGLFRILSDREISFQEFVILDLTGHVVKSGNAIGGQLDCAELPNGFYILSLKDEKGATSHYKIELLKE